MEKLILRSVMYGADKIPDHWFEKIPGGFYKEKDKNGNQKGGDRKGNSSTGTNSSGRRNSTAHDSRRSRDEDRRDDGRRSGDDRRRDRRSRRSYDGGADDDNFSGGRGRPPNQDSGRRRRHSLDSDRYEHASAYPGPPRDNSLDDRRRPSARVPYPLDTRRDSRRPPTNGSDASPNPFSPNLNTAAAVPPHPQSKASRSGSVPSVQLPQPPSSRNGNNTYVPYAHIYGQTSQSPRQLFSPPPSAGSANASMSGMASPPVVSPQQGYQQNPFAQQAPTAAAAGAGAAYTGQPGFINADARAPQAYDPKYNPRRYEAQDENDRAYSQSPPRHRPSRQDYSPPYDSYDSRVDDGRRSRSERRPDSSRAKSQNRGKSLSRIREAFDTSQRGLGYGAVGAMVGGLLGSEMGKGPVAMVAGATIGALGANAFQAREKRYVDPREPLGAQISTQQQPPPASSRRDDRRASEFQRDGPLDRRERGGRRAESGYHSD